MTRKQTTSCFPFTAESGDILVSSSTVGTAGAEKTFAAYLSRLREHKHVVYIGGNQMGIKPLSPCFDVLQRTSEDLKWSHLQICRTTDHGEWHQVLSASNRPETQLVLCFVSLFRHSLQPETFWVWNMLKYWPLTQRREKIVTQNFKTTNLCESKPQESFIVCIHVRSLIRWWLNVAASQQNRENERHTQGDNLHIIAVRSTNHHACKKKRCNKKGHQNHKEAFSRFLVSQRSSEL